MSSTCFEPEGSSSGRRLYVQLRYGMFYMLKLQQNYRMLNFLNVEIQHFILSFLIKAIYYNFSM